MAHSSGYKGFGADDVVMNVTATGGCRVWSDLRAAMAIGAEVLSYAGNDAGGSKRAMLTISSSKGGAGG